MELLYANPRSADILTMYHIQYIVIGIMSIDAYIPYAKDIGVLRSMHKSLG